MYASALFAEEQQEATNILVTGDTPGQKFKAAAAVAKAAARFKHMPGKAGNDGKGGMAPVVEPVRATPPISPAPSKSGASTARNPPSEEANSPLPRCNTGGLNEGLSPKPTAQEDGEQPRSETPRHEPPQNCGCFGPSNKIHPTQSSSDVNKAQKIADVENATIDVVNSFVAKRRKLHDRCVSSQDPRSSYLWRSDSQFRAGWDILMLLGMCYYAAAVPLPVLSDEFPYPWQIAAEAIITLLFVVDVCISFCTAHVVASVPVDSLYMAVTERAKQPSTWIDAFSSLPFDLLVLAAAGRGDAYYTFYAFRLLKLVKSYWVLTPLQRGIVTPTYVKTYYTIGPLLKTIMALVVSVHWIAIIGVPILYDKEPDTFHAYVSCLYYVIYTFTTTGFGDIETDTTHRRLFAIFVTVLGALVNGLVVAKLTSWYLSSLTADKRRRMRHATRLMEYFNIPDEIATEVLALQQHKMGDTSIEGFEATCDLPSDVRDELYFFINLKLVSSVPLFFSANANTKAQLVQMLTTEDVPRGTCIIEAGSVGEEMYFLTYGFVEVASAEGETLAVLGAGRYFGEISLITDRVRMASVNAVTHCSVLKLEKPKFLQLLALDTELRDAVAKEIRSWQGKHQATEEEVQDALEALESASNTIISNASNKAGSPLLSINVASKSLEPHAPTPSHTLLLPGFTQPLNGAEAFGRPNQSGTFDAQELLGVPSPSMGHFAMSPSAAFQSPSARIRPRGAQNLVVDEEVLRAVQSLETNMESRIASLRDELNRSRKSTGSSPQTSGSAKDSTRSRRKPSSGAPFSHGGLAK